MVISLQYTARDGLIKRGETLGAGGPRRKKVVLVQEALAYPADAVSLGHKLVLAAAIVALYLGVGVRDHDIWSPFEPAVAGVVWGMYTTGDLAVPRIDGLPYLEKPPLCYWMAWLCCKGMGRLDAGLIRLPSALFGLLAIGVTFWLARKRHGEAVAWAVAMLAATTLSMVYHSHFARTGIVATGFAFLAFGLFARTLLADEVAGRIRLGEAGHVGRTAGAAAIRLGEAEHVGRTAGAAAIRLGEVDFLGWDLAFAAALAVSFYAKNFYTFLIVLPPVVFFLLWRRRFRRLLRLGALVAACLGVALLPWCLALYRRGGWEFLRIVFVDNTVGRFFDFGMRVDPGPLNDAYTVERGHSHFLYGLALFDYVQPWFLLFVASAVALFRRRQPADDFRAFLRITAITIPVLLSLSSTRVQEYVAPVLFGVFLMMGELLSGLAQGAADVARWQRALVGANVVLVAAAAVGLPVVAAILLRRPLLLLWVLPAAVAVAALAARLGRPWPWPFAVQASSGVLAVAGIVACFYLIPYVNQRKTYAGFFEAIRGEVPHRELYTSCCDDNRLPLIPYYLNQEVPILRPSERVFDLLRTNRRAGIIVPASFYAKNENRFAQIPHIALKAARGQNAFVLVGAPREP